MLWMKETEPANVVVRGARVLDPSERIDATLDVRIDNGVVSQIGERVDTNAHRVVEGAGLVLAPAFVDPHVHLRTPGREDEETIASGTAAAAAVGFMGAITRGQAGEELTEMAELAEAGAAAFSDDGVPVRSAGLLRKALQYAQITGRPLALHCEEPSLTRGAHMHMGRVSAELGLGGYPSVGESVMVERDLALAQAEGQPLHLMHLSAAESVAALRRAREAGVRASGEVTPHHLVLTDDAVRSLDPNLKMSPPLREEHDRSALIDALRDGTIECIATDHAPHARHEKEVPFEAAPNGVTGLETAFAAVYTHLVATGVLPLATVLERMSAGPARVFGLERPRVATGAQANLVLLDLERQWRVGESFKSRSTNSWLLGATLTGGVVLTIAGGTVAHG
jgi:dihydroorotase